LVRLSTQVLPGEKEQDADARLRAFMQDVLPNLAQYLPSDTASEIKSVLNGATDGHS
jgi:hypothetical protein